jgi:hypothetical protein
MPTPVSIVASGAFPVVNTTRGVPVTAVAAPVYGMPVTIVPEVGQVQGFPINLVSDALVPLANIAPVVDFDNGAIWTVAGTGASATDNSFSASSAVGALAATPPLTSGRRYYYEVAFTITAGATLQIINGTTTTPVIDSKAVGGTMSGVFVATNTNLRLRATAASTTTVTSLILMEVPI